MQKYCFYRKKKMFMVCLDQKKECFFYQRKWVFTDTVQQKLMERTMIFTL